jgi:HEAT repeat protein
LDSTLVDELAFPGERRAAALEALTGFGADALPTLAAVLARGTPEAKQNAAKALYFLLERGEATWTVARRDEALNALLAALQSSDGDERASMIDALGLLRHPGAIPALLAYLDDSNYLCVCAARALGRTDDPAVVEPLARVLADSRKFWVPRGAAAVALGDLGAAATPALPALESALHNAVGRDETWDERAGEAVADAIARIRAPGTPSALTGHGSRYEMWGIS